MAPGTELSVELNCHQNSVIVTADGKHINVLSMASRLSSESNQIRDRVRLLGSLFSLALTLIFLAFAVLILHDLQIRELTNAWNRTTVTSRNGTVSGVPARKYNAAHAPEMSHPVQSQLHHDVVRVLRTAQYKAFAAMLDNMTESVVRKGVTVFAPSDGALSDYQEKKTDELRLEDVVKFHVVTDIMPYSNLLRLEVGSRLTTDVSNVTIMVTNATAGAYQVDDAVIISPDLYTDATIAVHGINAVFNTTKIYEEEPEEEEPEEMRPHPTPYFHSRAFKTPNTALKGIPVFQAVVSFASLYLIFLTAPVRYPFPYDCHHHSWTTRF
ncbi:hypothetical protein M758_2G174500 [Ceratodon purpureus]|nr:hypothetical protein M758_2G174500 [Ceratodon purpureus]